MLTLPRISSFALQIVFSAMWLADGKLSPKAININEARGIYQTSPDRLLTGLGTWPSPLRWGLGTWPSPLGWGLGTWPSPHGWGLGTWLTTSWLCHETICPPRAITFKQSSIHTHAQGSPASVGLAQAQRNYKTSALLQAQELGVLSRHTQDYVTLPFLSHSSQSLRSHQEPMDCASAGERDNDDFKYRRIFRTK